MKNTLENEMLDAAISWCDSNGINVLEPEQLSRLVNSLYVTVCDAAQPAPEVNAMLVEALEANHKWHQDYDDHGGYPESDLCEQNEAALTAAQQAQPVCGYDDTTGNCTRVNCCKQAQPERAPLSYWQVAKAFLKREQPTQRVDIFRSEVRFAEKHHGIKQGGQQ